jgi:DNA-binding SARP family transcriptional activator
MTTLRLHTLGAPRLHGPEGPLQAPIVRRRALALLAVTAGAGYPGIARERVSALLWPDSDAERAGNNLRQTLFTVRRMLGREVFVQDTTSLRINPDVLQVDIWDFEAAAATAQHDIVASLYGGEFMAGFSIAGLDELDRWLDVERGRLKRLARTSLERLTRDARHHGDREATLRWARALAALDPLSSRAALELLAALTTVGDRAGALEFAREYEALVREHLETVPDHAVTKFIGQLRQQPSWDGIERRVGAGEPARTQSAGATPGEDVVGAPISAGNPFVSPLQRALFDLVYLAPAHLLQAERHDACGEPALAMEHYATFLRMWQAAQHDIQAKVALAQSRLGALRLQSRNNAERASSITPR